VLQVLAAIRPNFSIGEVFMAEEFLAHNDDTTKAAFAQAQTGLTVRFEPHEAKFKPRVPRAIGLIRTGGCVSYSNMILVSA
jgi:D-ribose pyranase